MYTFNEIREYEPLQTKAFEITNSIRVLVAGNIAPLLDICRTSQTKVRTTGMSQVEAVAEVFAAHFSEYRRRRAEQTVLGPYGLTIEQYLSRQQDLSSEFVDHVTTRLSSDRYAGLGSEAIVAGVDETGAHIYAVRDPGIAQCYDHVGFVAVGSGAEYAMATFMERQYAPGASPTYALLLTYQAKRNAEVAPGVGYLTDINIVTRTGGILHNALSPLVKHLSDPYEARRLTNMKAIAEDHEKLMQFFAEQQHATTQPQPTAQSAQTASAPEDHEERISSGPEEGQPKD